MSMTYRNLEHELLAVVCGCQGVQDRGELVSVELDCEGKINIGFVELSQSSVCRWKNLY